MFLIFMHTEEQELVKIPVAIPYSSGLCFSYRNDLLIKEPAESRNPLFIRSMFLMVDSSVDELVEDVVAIPYSSGLCFSSY